ncbi:RNA 2',3'-cyclic phosphodiesterase [Epibacterium ulvae]|uniref:RNA 2',3'-cyclic phosphodiesterase n=1 Tax=Epibacterium ulvae TaxID=1156985 RepID=UPI001BFC35C8|nr:RNA 2',3'-cyclic phosphodiesterase [Epibacterium ulvae]MBT8153027.1 RNA 2',3'-cyclic phosphodiesterase [Epibacterium ulvae]
MRAFVGLPLSDPDLDRLEDLQAAVRVGRAVVPENLHLTLAFLDEQDVATLEALHAGLAQIALPALPLVVDHLDVMGGANPRVLCAMVADDPGLSALHAQVRSAVRQAEIDLPRTRFRPHITLTRFPRRMEPAAHHALAQFLGASGAARLELAPVTRFILYQSVLAPEGPTYIPLAEYPLGG